MGLEKIVDELELEREGLILHKSCDDAELSFLIAKALCKKLGCTLKELEKKCYVKTIY